MTVMENEKAAAVENYELTVEEPEEKTVIIEENGTARFTFTNTYTSTEQPQFEEGTLIVKKTFPAAEQIITRHSLSL